MKIALNRRYGLFDLSTFGHAKVLSFGLNPIDTDSLRINLNFIEAIEIFGCLMYDDESRIEIFEIPDNATDYKVLEYDGYETLIYIVDGKINMI